MLTTAAIVAGFCLDLLVGDPQWMPHPVRVIGWGIGRLERWLRRDNQSPAMAYLSGMLLVIVIVCLSGAVPFLLLKGLYRLHPAVGFVAESWMCYQILATKSLKDESHKVYQALNKGDLSQGRYWLSWIVGRDTAQLTEDQVAKGAVETVAENTSDGIIAPLLFMMVGGPALGLLYKGINTLDSMIGYNNLRYKYFGRFGAKLDDVANYVPSRMSAMLLILAAYLCGEDGRNAWRIYWRDRRNHLSPNSAQTESVVAGALHIQLAGSNYYKGVLVEKPTIGDPDQKIAPSDIKRAHRLLYTSAFLMLVLGVGLRLTFLR